MSEFIQDILLSNDKGVAAARAAFKASYSATKTKNSFTKVQMALEADTVLQDYFLSNIRRIEKWFNVITPHQQHMDKLRAQIATLARKDWANILDA